MIQELTKKTKNVGGGDVLAPLGVSVQRAAEMLQCSRTTVYGLIRNGHLRAYSLSENGSKRVLVHSIHDFANTGGVIRHDQPPAGVRIARNRSRTTSKWG